MQIKVDPQLIGKKLHRLVLSLDGQFVGEYERSQLADIDRKSAEVDCAAELLIDIYRRHGELKVRWNHNRGEKVIYVGDIERGVIPKECWRKPSWAK